MYQSSDHPIFILSIVIFLLTQQTTVIAHGLSAGDFFMVYAESLNPKGPNLLQLRAEVSPASGLGNFRAKCVTQPWRLLMHPFA